MGNEHVFVLERKELGTTLELEGHFVRYLYEKADSDFIIGLFSTADYRTFIAAGNVPYVLHPNRVYTVSGEITERENQQLGTMERQLRIIDVASQLPTDEEAIVKFLGNITGLTIANYIYYEYREDTMDVIQNDPDRVAREIKEVSLEVAHRLQAEVNRTLSDKSDASPFLQKYGFNLLETERLINLFGEEIVDMVTTYPYILMSDEDGLPGASLGQCDRIAQDIGFDMKDIRRIKEGVVYTLKHQGNNGHIYFSMSDIMYHTTYMLNRNSRYKVEETLIKKAVKELIEEKILYRDSRRIYLYEYYTYEKELAQNLVHHHSDTEWVPVRTRKEILDTYLDANNISLEKKQIEAILMLSKSQSGIGIMNGGAGTGKTFTIKIFLELMYKLYEENVGRAPRIQLMAPTGKAAKVMAGTTNMPATTVHKALEWTPDGFRVNQSRPLAADIIIVDEASMLDTYMAHSLTSAVPKGAKLVLMGDPNQLPSIGAGNILHDMVKTNVFDHVTLNVTRRQGAGSIVASNGRRITKEQAPQRDRDSKDPKAIIKLKQTPTDLLNQTVGALKYFINKGIHPDDIQVITPGRKGVVGVYHLNLVVQSILNPNEHGTEVLNQSFTVNGERLKLNFRVGDRVIHTTNTDKLPWVLQSPDGIYRDATEELGVATLTNGEIGTIVDILREKYRTQSGRQQNRDVIIVQYNDGLIQYNKEDFYDLDHAFAMTIHKSQGSQWKSVIQVISSEHTSLLDNSLLYTGYTRAEVYQVLLTDKRALEKSLKTRRTFDRRTSLDEQILREIKD